jgi:regulatory protein
MASVRDPAPRPRRAAAEPPDAGSAATDAEPDPESIARAIALRLLTAAPRSRAQLESALARRAVPPEVAERVLDRFTEVGLVDDTAYAQALVSSRHAERGLARRALAHELRAKGIDADVAQDALAGIDEADELAAARALVRRRAGTTADLDRGRRRRRLAAMLARKGYGPAVAIRVVDEVLGGDDGVTEAGAEPDEAARPWGEPDP